MTEIKAGFAICGSFCTFSKVIPQMKNLKEKGIDVYPIMSEISYSTDTRFGRCADWNKEVEEICLKKIISTVKDAEPIGPKKMLDILIIAPCTGNTLAKLALGIADTSVTLATKAHLRNGKPVLIGVSTNDALGANFKNIGQLMNTKNMYFVPFGQDDPVKKTKSLVAHWDRISETIDEAVKGKQIQPVIRSPFGK